MKSMIDFRGIGAITGDLSINLLVYSKIMGNFKVFDERDMPLFSYRWGSPSYIYALLVSMFLRQNGIWKVYDEDLTSEYGGFDVVLNKELFVRFKHKIENRLFQNFRKSIDQL